MGQVAAAAAAAAPAPLPPPTQQSLSALGLLKPVTHIIT